MHGRLISISPLHQNQLWVVEVQKHRFFHGHGWEAPMTKFLFKRRWNLSSEGNSDLLKLLSFLLSFDQSSKSQTQKDSCLFHSIVKVESAEEEGDSVHKDSSHLQLNDQSLSFTSKRLECMTTYLGPPHKIKKPTKMNLIFLEFHPFLVWASVTQLYPLSSEVQLFRLDDPTFSILLQRFRTKTREFIKL